MFTYAVKGDEKILVTESNIHGLERYRFIQQEELETNDYVAVLMKERQEKNRQLTDLGANSVIIPYGTWSDAITGKASELTARINEIDTELTTLGSSEDGLIEDIFNSLFT